MKLKSDIIQQINNVNSRRRISEKLNVSDQMLYRHLTTNMIDGHLTKIKPLLIIADELQLPVSDIIDCDRTELKLAKWIDCRCNTTTYKP